MTPKAHHEPAPETKPSAIDAIPLVFQGHRILDLTFRGRRAWLLTDVNDSMGYKPGTLSTLVSGAWSPEFVLDKHHTVLRGQDMRDFRAVLGDTHSEWVSTKTQRITLVYQEGLDLIALKTEKPVVASFARSSLSACCPSSAPARGSQRPLPISRACSSR